MDHSKQIDRVRKFRDAISAGNYDEALKLVGHANDLLECCDITGIALSGNKVPREVISATLQAFMDIHNNPSVIHGDWVHCLSHLVLGMWPRRMTGWLKKFYFISFQGARNLGDTTCCDGLVNRFAHYAKWSDDPAKFCLTSEYIELSARKWFYPHIKSRIEEAPFQSDADFLRWQFKHSETFYEGFDLEVPKVSFRRIHLRIQQLKKKGVNITEFVEMEQQFVKNQLNQLKKLLRKSKNDENYWEAKNLAERITKIAEFLAIIAYNEQGKR